MTSAVNRRKEHLRCSIESCKNVVVKNFYRKQDDMKQVRIYFKIKGLVICKECFETIEKVDAK